MYHCNNCNYFTHRKNDYEKHLKSLKHDRVIFNLIHNNVTIINEPNNIINNINNYNIKHINNSINKKLFTCLCGKKYKQKHNLIKHKKKCNYDDLLENQECQENQINKSLIKLREINNNGTNSINNDNTNNKSSYEDISLLTNLVRDVVKQNQELLNHNNNLTNQIFDIYKNQNINITNNNINSNNKTFNLNFFLNETCKNAMNITDFIESIKLQLTDLIAVGEVGYIEGISNIIIQNLKSLDITERPIHCTDKKREILYLKDANKWEKDNEKNKLRKVIKNVASKNIKLIPEYREKYPDYINSKSKKSDEYNKLIMEAMGGSGDNTLEKEDKIIKNIVKEVIIDKSLG